MLNERKVEVFDEQGSKHSVVYKDLTWMLAREATNSAFVYKNGLPDHLEPMTLATERMARMIVSIDGAPFTKDQMYAWSEKFGMNIASAIGAFGGESSADATFRNENEKVSQ